MLISKRYFNYCEIFVHCSRDEILNCINNEVLEHNISYACEELSKIRKAVGIPFIVSSWYRDTEHNKRVGGVPNSAHTQGLAIDVLLKGEDAKTVYKYCKENLDDLPIDQLIVYRGFIHFAFDYLMPRRQIILKQTS